MPVFAFAHPETPRRETVILPVFLSFMGCPSRCVFCAQDLQSGKKERPLDTILQELATDIERMARMRKGSIEVAFYGGTFTLLPHSAQMACLERAVRYKKKGIVRKVRASTRPDAVSREHLAELAAAGLDMLELGVQSFTDTALADSTRGYDAKTAVNGCTVVKESPVELGIQLMPGMPGMSGEHFRNDWQTALNLVPKALRLYPCLVLAGTPLETLYAKGEYAPWALPKTVELLAEALLASWRAGVPVIRIGLAPQPELENGGIVAGPAHPALGSMIRGEALFRYIHEKTQHIAPIKSLSAPRRVQGEFWGHRNSLTKGYAALGLHKRSVSFDGENVFTVTY